MKTSTKARIVLVAGLSILGTFVGLLNSSVKPESNASAEGISLGIESVLAQEQGQIEYKNTIRDQLNKNDYSGAIVTCNGALRDYPNDADFWYFKGFALAESKQFDEAEDAYNKGISVNVDKNYIIEHKNEESLGHFNKGLANINKNPDLAIEEYSKSQNLEPDNPSGFSGIGRVFLFAKKDFKRAIDYANNSLRVKPDYLPGIMLLGHSYYHNKQWKEASFYLGLATTIDSNYENRDIVLEMIDECSKHISN
ncbi:MAG: tetratricopeptide repeat protein [Deltaproteobacteria bacterium]|nr:tetratricopeptide repeat protein [Candidatus Zymogenaceae bacterium]